MEPKGQEEILHPILHLQIFLDSFYNSLHKIILSFIFKSNTIQIKTN